MAAISTIDRENIDNGTRLLAQDYIDYQLRLEGFEWTNRPSNLPNPPTRFIMVIVIDWIKTRYMHEYGNDGLLSALNMQGDGLSRTFADVCNTILRPNGQEIQVTGGRLFTLFAFSGLLAVECVRQEMPEQIDQVADLLVTYVQTNLSDWIASKGGWAMYRSLPNVILGGYGTPTTGGGKSMELINRQGKNLRPTKGGTHPRANTTMLAICHPPQQMKNQQMAMGGGLRQKQRAASGTRRCSLIQRLTFSKLMLVGILFFNLFGPAFSIALNDTDSSDIFENRARRIESEEETALSSTMSPEAVSNMKIGLSLGLFSLLMLAYFLAGYRNRRQRPVEHQDDMEKGLIKKEIWLNWT